MEYRTVDAELGVPQGAEGADLSARLSLQLPEEGILVYEMPAWEALSWRLLDESLGQALENAALDRRDGNNWLFGLSLVFDHLVDGGLWAYFRLKVRVEKGWFAVYLVPGQPQEEDR